MSWVAQARLIYAGLRNRLGLRETPVSQDFTLSNGIIPVTSVDDVLRERQILSYGPADPGADGWITVYTVPAGRRITIHSVKASRSSGTGLVFSALAILTRASIRHPIAEPAGASAVLFAPTNIASAIAGDLIQVYGSSYVAGAEITATMLIIGEDAY